MLLSVRLLKLLCFMLLFLPAVPGFSDELHVPGSYETIQDAVDAALEGDTVIVGDGTYQENIMIRRPMTIRSENGAQHTVVTALETDTTIFYVLADHVTIEGFTITGLSAAGPSGITVPSGYGHCTFRRNHVGTESSPNVYGIYLSNSEGNTVEDNLISSNTQYGLVIQGGSGNTLVNNSFISNGLYGIVCMGTEENHISGNEFRLNGNRGIILTNGGNSNLISDNNFSDNYAGIRISYSSNRNRVFNNSLENSTAGDILVDHESIENKIFKNTCMNSSNGRGVTLWDTGTNDVFENTVIGNSSGIGLQNVTGSRVYANSCSSNTDSGIIVFYSSQGNLISNNQCVGNTEYGIKISGTTLNTVRANTCSNNGLSGLYLNSAQENLLSRNTADGSPYGVWIQGSQDNRLFLNSFTDNTESVYSSESTTLWQTETAVSYLYQGTSHTGFLGNFYSDHDLTDSNTDGVTDTPKDQPEIDADDSYPLAAAHEFFTTTPGDMDYDEDVDGYDAALLIDQLINHTAEISIKDFADNFGLRIPGL